MKSIYKIKKVNHLILVLTVVMGLSSCKKFVDIPAAEGTLDWKTTFNNDGSATAATLNTYLLYNNSFLMNFSAACGLSSDEMFSASQYGEFLNNSIAPVDQMNGYIWSSAFSSVRECTLVIEGIQQSTGMSQAVKDQLAGEALVMRSLGFFNLLNLYGGVPLPLSIQETENAILPRVGTEEVWNRIFSDLLKAKELLKPDYPAISRARANRYAASALLARAYLYHKDWAKAEAEATEVISSGMYNLDNLDKVFKKESSETILQCYSQSGISPLGSLFLPPDPTVTPNVYLRPGFEFAFEKNSLGIDDLRKTNWTAQNTKGIHYINKYKVAGGSADEYTILFRLAEQYLIRAEARTWQNKLNGANSAETDLNIIRLRAGLDGKTGLSKPAMLAAIEQERRVELFGEYPHRWFDLKRSPGFINAAQSRADEVLGQLKGNFWQNTDVLYPIPASQIRVNPALVQNPGYN